MPSCRAQSRPDGLRRSRQVDHQNTNRRIICPSSLLRQGRGCRHLTRAFSRFSIDDSYEGMCPSPPLLWSCQLLLSVFKGVSRARGSRWQIILLIFHATLRALLQKLLCFRKSCASQEFQHFDLVAVQPAVLGLPLDALDHVEQRGSYNNVEGFP